MRIILPALATLLIATIPLCVRAQDAPSYAASDASATADEQVHGRIISFDGAYDVRVDDERGYVDRVRLHDGTIINPTGLTLAPGMVVSVLGYNSGSYFTANEIDTPYTSYDGGWYYRDHPYDYYGSSIGLSFFFGDVGWWHGPGYFGYGGYGHGGYGHGGGHYGGYRDGGHGNGGYGHDGYGHDGSGGDVVRVRGGGERAERSHAFASGSASDASRSHGGTSGGAGVGYSSRTSTENRGGGAGGYHGYSGGAGGYHGNGASGGFHGATSAGGGFHGGTGGGGSSHGGGGARSH